MRWWWLAGVVVPWWFIRTVPAACEEMRRDREMICADVYFCGFWLIVLAELVIGVSWARFIGASWPQTPIGLAVWEMFEWFVSPVVFRGYPGGWSRIAWLVYRPHRDHRPDDCEYGPPRDRVKATKPRLVEWRKVTVRPAFTPT